MTHTQGATRLAYIDVLRAVAILVVMICHLPGAASAPFGALHFYGGRGVDLFFVLSGFLIGTTALERRTRAAESTAGAQAKAYWILRTARIFPLYFLLLAVIAIGGSWIERDATFVLREYPLPYLTFTANYLPQGSFSLGVLWSLAVEEQFYLVVGLVVASIGQSRETLRAGFGAVAIFSILIALLARYDIRILFKGGELVESTFGYRLFHGTLARIDQLGLGLGLSILAPSLNARLAGRVERFPIALTLVAIGAGLFVMTHLGNKPRTGFLILGTVFAIVVYVCQRPGLTMRAQGRGERLLLAPIERIGQLSFGMYLFHPLARPWVERLLAPIAGGSPQVYGLTFAVTWIAAVVAMAQVSYSFFEMPILERARTLSRAALASRSISGPLAARDENQSVTAAK